MSIEEDVALVKIEEDGNTDLFIPINLLAHAQSKLTGRTPAEKKLRRAGPGGTKLSYITWSYAAERMNEAFGAGNWSKEIINENVIKGDKQDEIVVKIRVTCPYGSQEAYGGGIFYKNNPNGTYADAAQIAVSKAFRRAVAPWGIGLDLYTKEDSDIREENPDVLLARAAFRSYLNYIGSSDAGVLPILRKKYGEHHRTTESVRNQVLTMQPTEVEAIWEMIETLQESLNAATVS